MGERECRTADAGAYYRSCAGRIMAKAYAGNRPSLQHNPLCSSSWRKGTWQPTATSAPAGTRSWTGLA